MLGGVSMFYVPTSDVRQWRKLLADSDKQWRREYSAFELAHAWSNLDGFPTKLQQIFLESNFTALQDLEILLKIPEYQVSLDTKRAPSQNDLFVLARNKSDLIAIMVEGKVDEPFGPTVNQWLEDASSGKKQRLDFLTHCLNLPKDIQLYEIHYQLLHRAASAILEAQRFHAKHALMLVHSFSPKDSSFENYIRFVKLFNQTAAKDSITNSVHINGIQLHFGWLSDTHASNIDIVWNNLMANEGERFTQIRGGTFKYKVKNKYIVTDRTNVQITKKSIDEALTLRPLTSTTSIQHLRAPSYIYALLTDDRIINDLEKKRISLK